MKRFENKVALITGGGRGIGRAICVRLAQEGANIVFSGRNNDENVAETIKQVEATGAKVRFMCNSFIIKYFSHNQIPFHAE